MKKKNSKRLFIITNSVQINLPGGRNVTWYDIFTDIGYQSNYPSKFPVLVPSYNNVEHGEKARPPVYAFARGGTILF